MCVQVTKAPTVKPVELTAPAEHLASKLHAKRAADDDRALVGALESLLQRMLALDPAKRMTVKEALAHPFIRGRVFNPKA